MTARTRLAETDLAAVVVQHFGDLGAEVYQEVACGSRCDVVVKDGQVLHAIEVKTSFSLAVIGQALGWLEHAHRVSVAVPYGSRNGLANIICRRFGIGVYLVRTAACATDGAVHLDHFRVPFHGRGVVEDVRPVFRRRVSLRLLNALREEQKTHAPAGNADGDYWTPRKAVSAALREAVEARPGMTWREAMACIRHHYQTDSSAASAFSRIVKRWPRTAKSIGLDWLDVTDDRPARLYLKGQAPSQPEQRVING